MAQNNTYHTVFNRL